MKSDLVKTQDIDLLVFFEVFEEEQGDWYTPPVPKSVEIQKIQLPFDAENIDIYDLLDPREIDIINETLLERYA